ncbi:MAG: hypothetical protein AAGB22_11150 [Bacteroidota bacterium]
MIRTVRSLCLLCGLVSTAMLSAQENAFTYSRQPSSNQELQYSLRTDYYENGSWKRQTVARAVLTATEGDVPQESVRWTSLVQHTAADTIRYDTNAQRTAPYSFSLHPEGSLEAPRFDDPVMLSSLADLTTFLVAISPQAGSHKVQQAGGSYHNPEPARGDFSDAFNTPVGEDCMDITVHLVRMNRDTAVYRTTFLVPAKPCLELVGGIAPSPENPVNFQMAQGVGNGRMNLLYGQETFVVESHVRRRDGALLSATMDNVLDLRMKVFCDAQYANCQTELPWKISRKVVLSLVP